MDDLQWDLQRFLQECFTFCRFLATEVAEAIKGNLDTLTTLPQMALKNDRNKRDLQDFLSIF